MVVYFVSFGIGCILEEALNKVRDKSITYNIFRLQEYDSTIWGVYCTAFIEYLIAGKTLLSYISLFSSNVYQKNGKVIYEFFKDKYGNEKLSLD